MSVDESVVVDDDDKFCLVPTTSSRSSLAGTTSRMLRFEIFPDPLMDTQQRI